MADTARLIEELAVLSAAIGQLQSDTAVKEQKGTDASSKLNAAISESELKRAALAAALGVNFIKNTAPPLSNEDEQLLSQLRASTQLLLDTTRNETGELRTRILSPLPAT